MTKKYKLIKNFPLAPKVGTIVFYSEKTGRYHIEKEDIGYPYKAIEDYPEFWEEVVKKDYEIISLKNDKNIIIGPEGIYNFNSYINSGLWSIYSIKRLSDGEIFAVGDKVEGTITDGMLLNIIICKNPKSDVVAVLDDKKYINKIFLCVNNSIGNCKLEDARKIKIPLFTTEDGVDIFEGDKCIGLDLSDWSIFIENKSDKNQDLEFFKYFSTNESANKYIKENKPKFNEKDMVKFAKYCKEVSNVENQLEEFIKFNLKNG